ncbi:MAG: UDP-2,3-diacylglucosamine diphosphatase LpxI [Magnetococcales bacterium]|nr:UDP-2,3-diacylglucosamine diphosphatase LpxI [Magnetococcales bacterium]
MTHLDTRLQTEAISTSTIERKTGFSRPPPGTRIGLIAGSGSLPIVFAKSLLDHTATDGTEGPAYPLFIAAHDGEADPSICQYASAVKWVRLGQFKKIIQFMTQQKVSWIVLAGGITKTSIWKIRPDSLALSLVVRLGNLHDDKLLRAVAGELEKQGFTVGSVTDFVPELLVPSGILSQIRPDSQQWEEIQFGWKAAKELGRLDIGQGVVVKRKVVISVEAIEGTDAMIERSGHLISGSKKSWANQGSAILVKTAKPIQDHRLDLPTIGPRTMENLHKANIRVVAVEAGATMILEPEATIKLADKYRIILVGCTEQSIRQPIMEVV